MTGCTKVRYRDRVSALLTLATVQHKDGSARRKIEKRAYRCPRCHGWHLTSAATPRAHGYGTAEVEGGTP